MARCPLIAASRAFANDPEADPRALAGLLLAVLRGIEALGRPVRALHSIAETALAVLTHVSRSN